jgi:hypothetical protein
VTAEIRKASGSAFGNFIDHSIKSLNRISHKKSKPLGSFLYDTTSP